MPIDEMKLTEYGGELSNIATDWQEDPRPGEPASAVAVLRGVSELRRIADEVEGLILGEGQ